MLVYERSIHESLMFCLSFNLMYVLVAVSLERYTMAQTNPDKSKLFIHLYVYFVSNCIKIARNLFGFVTHSAARTTSMCLFVLDRMSFSSCHVCMCLFFYTCNMITFCVLTLL